MTENRRLAMAAPAMKQRMTTRKRVLELCVVLIVAGARASCVAAVILTIESRSCEMVVELGIVDGWVLQTSSASEVDELLRGQLELYLMARKTGRRREGGGFQLVQGLVGQLQRLLKVGPPLRSPCFWGFGDTEVHRG